MHTATRLAWPAAYVAGIVLANLMTEHLGLWPAGWGPTAGTYAAALVLIARNLSQDAIGKWATLALMAVGVALSWFLASPALAVASAVAFGLSELADMAVYTPLRDKGRGRAVAIACTVGAVVDTLVFLWLAAPVINPGGGLPWAAVPAQLAVKAGMGWIAAAILRSRHRAVDG